VKSPAGLNRSQLLVLAFIAAAVAALVVVLVIAPGVYTGTLKLAATASPLLGLALLAPLLALLCLLAVGVVRRWRWMFWLIVVAFLAGVLRVPAALLEARGVLPATGPGWYSWFQAVVGMIQFLIGLALLKGYRRGGVWGEF